MQSTAGERGQALILWVLAATVILVMGAIVVDVGLWLTERRRAQLAADFAALAAATELHPGGDPVQTGLDFAERNGFDDADPGVEVQVNPNYAPDMVEVTIQQDSPMLFTSIFGAGAFDIGARAVGADPAEDVDVVMILDRSRSIEGPNQKTQQDVDRMKEGARAALQVLDPTTQHVALGVMSKSDLSTYDSGCSFANDSWVPVPLSADYHNAASPLVTGIDCLARLDSTGIPQGLSSLGTNWAHPIGDPIGGAVAGALSTLQGGRPGVRKAIILLADGHPQDPGSDPCESAVDRAADAKAEGVEIYTIGYAIENDDCSDDSGSSSYNGSFSEALADMATDQSGGSCTAPAAENTDGDHFFCLDRFENLTPVFEQIAAELARDYRLEE